MCARIGVLDDTIAALQPAAIPTHNYRYVEQGHEPFARPVPQDTIREPHPVTVGHADHRRRCKPRSVLSHHTVFQIYISCAYIGSS